MLTRPESTRALPQAIFFGRTAPACGYKTRFAGEPPEPPSAHPADDWQRNGFPVHSAQTLDEAELATHQRNIRRVLQYAQAAAQIPNYSGRHYAALVVTDQGVEGLAANYEASREIPTCDLRAALTSAYNQQVGALAQDGQRPEDLKVKTVYLVNADPHGEQPVPCADCQALLTSDAFPPDTQVVGLHHDETGNENFIYVRRLSEMLPLHKGEPRPVMITAKAIDALPVSLSEHAKKQLDGPGGVPQEKLLRLLKRARLAYEDNDTAEYSKKKTGTGALLSPFNLMVGGSRFEWTTRWFESPDLMSAAQGFQQSKRLQAVLALLPRFVQKLLDRLFEIPKVKALAYYGDDPHLPPVASLGRIGRRRGCSETLIVTVENDAVKIRTIADFMPEMYQTPDPKKTVGV